MRIINTASGMTTLLLGRLGENERTQFVFDVADWLEEYPAATIAMYNQLPHSEESYPVVISQPENGKVTWTVADSELQTEGYGRCELVAVEGETVVKGHIWKTRILESLDGAGEVPDPWESWMTEFTQLKGAAEDAAEAAEDAKESIEGMSVEATTLPAGSDATVTKTVDQVTGAVTMSFGLPQGRPGTPGYEAIDDAAGLGDTDKAWSADKLSKEFAKDRNNANISGSLKVGTYNTTVQDANTVAFGRYSTAVGTNSLASGNDTNARGSASQAFGAGSKTEDDASASAVFGAGNIAKGAYQLVFGRYNAVDNGTPDSVGRRNYIEIVGNGNGTSSRLNARTLDWQGNERLRGNLYVEANVDGSGGTQVAKITDIPDLAIDDTAGTGDTDVTWSADKITGELADKYEKPASGIPATDLASGVIPTVHNVPAGGTTGQVLTKTSGTDYATEWTTPQVATDAQVAQAVDDWLDENVAQETGYVLDRTLLLSNAAAPADLVGDLKNTIDDVNIQIDDVNIQIHTGVNHLNPYAVINGKNVKDDGTLSDGSSYSASGYIDLDTDKDYIVFTRYDTSNTNLRIAQQVYRVAFYNSSKTFMSVGTYNANNEMAIPSGAKYARFSCLNANYYWSYSPMVEFVDSVSEISATYVCYNRWDEFAKPIDDLEDGLDDLTDEVLKTNGMTALEYTYDGKEINTAQTTANINSPTTASNFRCAVISCNPGDMFTINVDGGTNSRAWAFTKSDGTVLDRSDTYANHPHYRDEIITAPKNTAYLVLNDRKTGLTSYKNAYDAYKIGLLQTGVAKVDNFVWTANDMSVIEYTGEGYIETYNTTASVTTIVSNSNWRYALIECQKGDEFTINADGGDGPRAWAFVAQDGTVLDKAEAGSTHPHYLREIIVAPFNTKYLVINDRKTGLISYKGMYNCDRISRIQDGVENKVIEKNIESLDAVLGMGINRGIFTSSSNPDSFVLLHFSDIHGDSDNMKNISYVREYLEDVLDDTLCTGDIVTYYATDSMTFWDSNSDGSILTCIGNHDVKVSGTTGYITSQPTEAEQYAKYMSPYISNWGTIEHSDTNLYYYKDYAAKKIRLIVLNSLYNTEAKVTEQNTWLATALAGAKTAGYGVVIGQHYYPVSGTKISCTFSAEVNFPSSMNSPENYMYNGDALTTYQATVQDFIDGGGNFVCWLCGHKHADYIAYHPTYPKQVFIGVGGALFIAKSAEYEDTSDMRRVQGTRSQDCMNVLAIDPSDKKIKVIRIGCDRDYLGRHRGSLTLDYSTSPATVIYND